MRALPVLREGRVSPGLGQAAASHVPQAADHSRGQENGRCPHELQFASQDGHAGKEAVQEVDGQVEGLGSQLVLLGHLHQPVHQDPAHAVRDVGLLPQVVRLGPASHLCGEGVSELRLWLQQRDHTSQDTCYLNVSGAEASREVTGQEPRTPF